MCDIDNHALAFDGVDDFALKSGFAISGDFTISAWFNADLVPNGGNDDRVVSFGPSDRMEIGVANNGNLWLFDDKKPGGVTSYSNVRDGLWHQVVLTRSGNNSEIYLDGVSVEAYIANSASVYGSNFSLGRWTGGLASTHFKGTIDEVSVWDMALSASDVSSLNNCNLEGTEFGLVSLFKMDQGVSEGDNTNITQIIDEGPGLNHLDLRNFALDGSISNFICSGTDLTQSCSFCSSPPVASCHPNLSFALDPNTGEVIVAVTDVDDGSSSICDQNVTLSFDPNTIVTTITYTCPEEIGDNVVTLYVNDSNGQSSCTSNIEITTSDTELLGLINFYNEAGGDDWNDNTGWLTNCDPCGLEAGNDPWFGLDCTNQGQVDGILMFDNNPSGTLISDLTVFPALEVFIVLGDRESSTPNLSGPLPSMVPDGLLRFGVDRNSLSGMIPPVYSSLQDLFSFSIRDNQISGSLPILSPSIESIGADKNMLTGEIPSVYGSYMSLASLIINDNQLSGCYDYLLYGLCNSTMLITSTNGNISDGNNFDADWEDFCSSGAGFCCVPDLVIDTDPIQSGFYFSSQSITIQTTIDPGSVIILDAPVVNIVNPAIVSNGAVVTTNNVGCQ